MGKQTKVKSKQASLDLTGGNAEGGWTQVQARNLASIEMYSAKLVTCESRLRELISVKSIKA